jgi:hypothetical protein
VWGGASWSTQGPTAHTLSSAPWASSLSTSPPPLPFFGPGGSRPLPRSLVAGATFVYAAFDSLIPQAAFDIALDVFYDANSGPKVLDYYKVRYLVHPPPSLSPSLPLSLPRCKDVPRSVSP